MNAHPLVTVCHDWLSAEPAARALAVDAYDSLIAYGVPEIVARTSCGALFDAGRNSAHRDHHTSLMGATS